MPRFLYELTMAGGSESDAPQIGRLLSQAALRLAAAGADVTLLSADLIPGQSRLVCTFDAADAEVVRSVAHTAQVPGTGVVQLVPVLCDGTGSPGARPRSGAGHDHPGGEKR